MLGRRQLATATATATETAPTPSPGAPSAEQQAIVRLSRTQNVVVSARPGAGKTATAEQIVAANPNRPIAVITYSKRLQLETARRLGGYPSCDVYTFHGMAGRLFSAVVYNDSLLFVYRNQAVATPPTWTGEPYEIIILDEMQDCTEPLFWLVCTFISSVTRAAEGRAPRIVVLGDERQAIYDFKGADARFLSLAPTILTTLSPYPWTQLPLSKSFRLSHETSDFTNKVFLGGENYITGSHHGPKPLYIHGNLFDVETIAQQLVPLILKYGPECTAILAPTIRNNTPLSTLTNHLSRFYGLPVAVSISDEVSLDEHVVAGKICVSTIHQFKGNERDLVIVYGVDNGYFKFIGRDLPDDRCPNAIFVALTRARKQLVAMHDYRQRPMPFVNMEELHEKAQYIDFSDADMQDPAAVGRPIPLGLLLPRNVHASLVVRHVPDQILDAVCKTHLDITVAAPPLPQSEHIGAPDKVLTDAAKLHHEAVSDLNSLAVVAEHEFTRLGTLTTLGFDPDAPLPAVPSDPEARAAWLCRQACGYEANVSGYKSRHIQMQGHDFDWLDEFLEVARDRLAEQFDGAGRLEFEVKLRDSTLRVPNEPGSNKKQTTCLAGRVDIVRYDNSMAVLTQDDDVSGTVTKRRRKKKAAKTAATGRSGDGEVVSIWEIKMAAKLVVEHVIQACIYAYLWTVCAQNGRRGGLVPVPGIVLFNVRDGERWEIHPKDGTESLRNVVEEVLRAKHTSRGMPTTEEFLEKCIKTMAEVER
ncbi:hypothetical protein DHEL01_v212976 [Diaporthe helianthi]|uniref:UvrD-like helicase C-terminal domain-containing protein n=1 Tax=Diaporthe helianthi TaxID=158607 RepID=A0A2P5HEG0_DIAHE|nr:hypothetical protein DHEL01_v212976 [Diaporthe helianthi]